MLRGGWINQHGWTKIFNVTATTDSVDFEARKYPGSAVLRG